MRKPKKQHSTAQVYINYRNAKSIPVRISPALKKLFDEEKNRLGSQVTINMSIPQLSDIIAKEYVRMKKELKKRKIKTRWDFDIF
jgi:hypothetical protein